MNAAIQREEELYDAARKLSDPAGRRAYLDSACAGDPALRARVENLLALAAEAERFFTEGGTALNVPLEQLQLPPRPRAPADAAAADGPGEEPVGARIGRYKLLEKIGEGGC